MDRQQHRFKVGDRVRRNTGPNGDVLEGNIYTVSRLVYFMEYAYLKLKETETECNQDYFDLVDDDDDVVICYNPCSLCGSNLEDFKTDTGCKIKISLESPSKNEIHLCLNCLMEIVNG